jgi:hypothetical protein
VCRKEGNEDENINPSRGVFDDENTEKKKI